VRRGETLHRAFQRRVGTTPEGYRRQLRAGGPTPQPDATNTS
jgi:AraC-like DNA-binding protein